MGGFSTDVLFGQVNMGTVSQVVYDDCKLLQRFPNVLRPLQLLQVVTLAILKCRSNFFVRRANRDAM
jgi:hypothetical protein